MLMKQKNKQAVILFSRVPVPGKTKTRLMPALSGEACVRLHRRFLQMIARQIRLSGADFFLCYTGVEEEAAAIATFSPYLGKGIHYLPQRGDDLGERMYHGLKDVLKLGYASCLLVGSDVPEISADILIDALNQLKEHDLVFGPVRDGGYYLVGMKKPQPAVFRGQTYSHESVLRNALQAAESAGLSYGLVKTLSDVDTPEDLNGMKERLGRKREKQKKQALISVIIPVYNEEKTIIDLQKQLRPYLSRCEILLVDGGSTDRTLSLIAEDFCLLHSEKGRANQMNLGARVANGEILFFLHSDSRLPGDFLEEIRQVMARYPAGCFGIRFSSGHFFMWTCQLLSNLRARYGKIMFGDQGIFIRRDLFMELGGFPSIPIMEDYQLSLTMKEKKIPLGMTRHRILTSDRRYPKGSMKKLLLMWKMYDLRCQYRNGVSPELLAGKYRDIR